MVTGSTTSRPARRVPCFVPTAELVCNQGFEWSEVRKHSDVGRLTSCQRSYLHGLSRASVAEPSKGRAVRRATRRDPPYKPTALAVRSFTLPAIVRGSSRPLTVIGS